MDYLSSSSQPCLLVVFRLAIEEKKAEKKFGTARNFQRTLNSLTNFLGDKAELPLSLVNEDFVGTYNAWLLQRGVARNSVSFYMRVLRSICNKLSRLYDFQCTHLFRDVYTGVASTRKRAVNENILLKLQALELRPKSHLALSRDVFIFSYCARGMAFVDIAFLQKSDISDGVLCYVRRKTGQYLTVRIEPCMARIIKKYAAETAGSPYVFPFLRSLHPSVAYKQYQTALGYYNRVLKKLTACLGLLHPLSSYTARHTWATTARNHNVPISVISAGMGHSSERTTQIYLASLDNSVIDKANSMLLKSLNSYEG